MPVVNRRRLLRLCSHHGGLRMTRRLLLLLFAVTLGGLLLQLLLYLRHGPPPWMQPRAHHHDDDEANNVTRGLKNHSRDGFILNEPDACSNLTELVMVVVTAVNNTEDRQAVRETWGSSSSSSSVKDSPHPHLALVFLVGTASERRLQDGLELESRRHRDIVQADFVDSYRNLSLKSVSMLKWVNEFCSGSRFVLKADDDMYVNVTYLLSALRKEALSHSTFILGHVFTNAKRQLNKNSKWYTPKEEFKEDTYPRYASGTAYAMTTSAAVKLFAATAEVPLFWLEDIYVTGLCARKAKVSVYHHYAFNYIRLNLDSCRLKNAISAHRYSAQEKRTIFRQFSDPAFKCRPR